MTHKQVIVIRKDLNMRKGKMVAQGAHASMAVLLDLMEPMTGSENWEWKIFRWDDPRIGPWLDGAFTKICVSVNSEEELLEIHNQARKAGIITAAIKDSGKTEFNGVPTYTAVAVGPDLIEKVDAITGYLPLL